MTTKHKSLIIKYIFLFLFLISITLIFWICNLEHLYSLNHVEYAIETTLLVELLYTLFLLPYIEIKLCEKIAKEYSDTPLIKLLSSWIVPTICLGILFIIDALVNTFAYLSGLTDIMIFVCFVSFSANFIPIFLMGIRYKILAKKDVNEFFKNDAWTIFLVIMFYCILKLIGIFIFIPLFDKIAEIIK